MSVPSSTGIAIVGTGYVADAYRLTLDQHRSRLALRGVWDRDGERLAQFTRTFGDPAYDSLAALLDDQRVAIVVNLTDPHAHADVSRQILAAGKHLYSEKPLAMSGDEARQLRDLAASKGLRISAAPCNLLSESAQTLWKAVRDGVIGDVRLVYAELDDGMIHRVDRAGWLSRSGKPWPASGEYAVGCTFEHAGYVLTLLAALFGPVVEVTAFADLRVPSKDVPAPAGGFAPDFSVGCLRFDNGVVARLTNSIVAPYDHRLRVIGDTGVLEIAEPWDYAAPVRLSATSDGRLARFVERRFGWRWTRSLRPVRRSALPRRRGLPTMDFMRGVCDLAEAIDARQPAHLDADFAVHIAEVTEALQYPARFGRPARIDSRFSPIAPMSWAL